VGEGKLAGTSNTISLLSSSFLHEDKLTKSKLKNTTKEKENFIVYWLSKYSN
jgi:hypothetical protein